jgi:LL-H family phage holin
MENITTEILGALTLALVNVGIALVVGIIGMSARNIITLVKAKTTSQQQSTLTKLATTAVIAAEQMFKDADGSVKLDFATKQVELFLERRGVNVSSDQIRTAIEAAVRDEIKLFQPKKTDTDEELLEEVFEFDPPSTPRAIEGIHVRGEENAST